jgi:hypothetical protein
MACCVGEDGAIFTMVSELIRGWQPDPFGLHEHRFFSDDGKPTLLVRDGSVRSYDPPPSTGGALFIRPVLSEPECELRPTVAWQTPEKPATNGSSGMLPAAVVFHPVQVSRSLDAAVGAPLTSKSAKVVYVVVLTAMAASALALAVVHFTHSGNAPGPGAVASTSTTSLPTTTSTAAPTTTPPLPASLQPSAAVAAADFISSWASGNRTEALSVATAPAVATLFAGHYTRSTR